MNKPNEKTKEKTERTKERTENHTVSHKHVGNHNYMIHSGNWRQNWLARKLLAKFIIRSQLTFSFWRISIKLALESCGIRAAKMIFSSVKLNSCNVHEVCKGKVTLNSWKFVCVDFLTHLIINIIYNVLL
jgi:hypothetical protein